MTNPGSLGQDTPDLTPGDEAGPEGPLPHPEPALLLVFTLCVDWQDLHTSIPLVCKAWYAAASATYGSRPFIENSFQVQGPIKTLSLALWLQHHSSQLLNLQLSGFKHGVTAAWWERICSSAFNQLQQLILRSCGSPDLPLHLLAAASSLRCLKLEHTPEAPAVEALAGLKQLTSLCIRSCHLTLEHLEAVGRLTGLVELGLAKNSFVGEGSGSTSPRPTHASTSSSTSSTSSTSSSTVVVAASTSSSATGGEQAAAVPGVRQLSDWVTGLPAVSATTVQGLGQLKVLNLSDCRLQETLLDQLPLLTSLTKLQLRSAPC